MLASAPCDRQKILIGLLIAATLMGSIDVALRSDYVTAAAPQKEKPPFAKFQDRLIAAAEPATARSVSLQTPGQSASVAEAEASASTTFTRRPASSRNPHHRRSRPQEPAQLLYRRNQALLRSPIQFRSQEEAQQRPRAPSEKADNERSTNDHRQTNTNGRRARRTMPKPMAFGSIGYNYNPQQ